MNKIEINSSNKLNILTNCKKKFQSNIKVSFEQKKACLEFASRIYDEDDDNAVHTPMAFGGREERNKEEIFLNTLQGKIAEFGFYNYFKNRVSIQEPDMELWGRGKWEDTDFTVTHDDIDYTISIKSTKHFGNLLLLESNRYDEKGRYLESADGGEPKVHDWIFLIRVSGVEYKTPEAYTDEVLHDISVEVSGYIGKNMFKHAIQHKKILKAGITIGSVPLQVDNYWFCLTELLDPSPKN